VGCRAFVWPNIAPENPVTTTKRALHEALDSGLPPLLGREAYFYTEFVETGLNGFLYNNVKDLKDFGKKIIENYQEMGQRSLMLNAARFDFNDNFIAFYKMLYAE
jgi:hypothetical protein